MIESANANELQGQYELDDLMPKDEGTGNREQGTGIAEGYDSEGNLLNIDYPPLQKPSPGGEGGTAQAVTDEVPRSPSPQHPADTGKLPYTKPEILSGPPQTPAPADRLNALATEIRVITEQTRATVISAALAVGKRLIEAKAICPAGRWLEWLKTAVDYSERKAQDMMRLYEAYGRDGSIPDSIAALDYSKAVAMLSAPAEAREALAEKAAGEDLSVRKLQDEIKMLKAEKLKDQARIDDYIGKTDRLRDEIARLDDREQEYDRAIVERDSQIKAAKAAAEKEREAAQLANAKAAAAEASAEELRKLHSDAEDRAAKSAQRAIDAVNRANQVAKDLADARAKIQALSEAAAAANGPEVQTVEVVPEAVTRELEQLRRDLAEARASSNASHQTVATEASATDKFKWFYANQMKPTFTTALSLLKDVAQEDGHAADAFATAITNACKVLMSQLGTKEE